MTGRLLFILGFALVLCGSAAAQRKNITNADLEKFRQKRLQIEKDYRENYERLGMPSPEELTKRDEQKRRENADAATRFRAERQQEEQNQALREQAENEQRYYQPPLNSYAPRYGTNYGNNFGYAPYNYYPGSFYRFSYGTRFSRFRYDNNRRYFNQIPIIRLQQPIRQTFFPINTRRFPRGRR